MEGQQRRKTVEDEKTKINVRVKMKIDEGCRENASFHIDMTKGETLLSALQGEKPAFFSYGNCGGRGSCGRCKVRF